MKHIFKERKWQAHIWSASLGEWVCEVVLVLKHLWDEKWTALRLLLLKSCGTFDFLKAWGQPECLIKVFLRLFLVMGSWLWEGEANTQPSDTWATPGTSHLSSRACLAWNYSRFFQAFSSVKSSQTLTFVFWGEKNLKYQRVITSPDPTSLCRGGLLQ